MLPLSAASNKMQKRWINTNNSTSNTSHNKTKKLITNITASSTSQNIWSSSEDENEEEKDIICKDKEECDDKECESKHIEFTESEQNLIGDERVRCCHECWLDYYRGKCIECEYEYCLKCRCAWHDNYDCDEIKKEKKRVYLEKKLQDAQTEELMLRSGWRRCKGCNVWVAKTEGCNHMTHINCPNPNDLDEGNCHFCYCCGELLYDPYRKHEIDGTVHFENGVFNKCRNANDAQIQRDEKHNEIKNNIQQIENEMDQNGIIIESEQCILM